MSFHNLGVKADLAQDYRTAIENYKNSVEAEECQIQVHLNLIGILISICVDYGLWSYLVSTRTYSEGELNTLCQYLHQLIHRSKITFPQNSEIDFWGYYIEKYYEGFSVDELREFAFRDPDQLVPFFQLYVSELANGGDVRQYESQIGHLKEEVKQFPSIKNRYILSILEGAENSRKLIDSVD